MGLGCWVQGVGFYWLGSGIRPIAAHLVEADRIEGAIGEIHGIGWEGMLEGVVSKVALKILSDRLDACDVIPQEEAILMKNDLLCHHLIEV